MIVLNLCQHVQFIVQERYCILHSNEKYLFEYATFYARTYSITVNIRHY